MRDTIRLRRLNCDGNRLSFEFDTSLKFFKSREFFIEYNRPIPPSDESILAIPFAAVMAPIAWATGAELEMPSLDSDFAASLAEGQEYFKKWFPKKWAFGGTLKTRFVPNCATGLRPGMLFSGGVDSLTTYAAHREEGLRLFTIFGTDIPLAETGFISLCRQKFDAFAEAEKADLIYIRSNVRDILDLKRLKRFVSGCWYTEVAHGLMMASLTVPISYPDTGTLYVASCSHRPGGHYSCGSERELIEKMRWAGSGILNDRNELNRMKKIAFLKSHPELYRYLRVCWSQFSALNCGKCEKCLRTICELLANNVDPALCNFSVNNDTLASLKKRMIRSYHFFFRSDSGLDFWRCIQEEADWKQIEDRYGAREFFRWLSGFDRIRQPRNPLVSRLVSSYLTFRHGISHAVRPLKTSVLKKINPVLMRA